MVIESKTISIWERGQLSSMTNRQDQHVQQRTISHAASRKEDNFRQHKKPQPYQTNQFFLSIPLICSHQHFPRKFLSLFPLTFIPFPSHINTPQNLLKPCLSYQTTLPKKPNSFLHVMASRNGVVFEDFFPAMVEKLGAEKFMKELCNGFRLLVDKEKGVITFESLKRNSALLGLQDMSDDEVGCMLREGDLDGDGALNEMEFCTLMLRLSPELMNNSRKLLLEAIVKF